MTGYLHPGYAASLREFGTPRELPRSGGWILERKIPGTSCCDAMGPYPLFCCRDWAGLCADIDELDQEGRLISLALVTDPLSGCDETRLKECFKDRMFLFKQHFMVRQPCDMRADISKHHVYYAGRALRDLRVEAVADPSHFVREWTGLYEVLKQRHALSGLHAFSETAFQHQLEVPGAVYFRALHGGACVGGHIWYSQNDAVYSHLAAFSDKGYDLMASYALYWRAIEYFSEKVKWMDLGAGAGMDGSANDGLTRFKRGWSTDTRPVYLCGRIFNRSSYDELTKNRSAQNESFFPAYRANKPSAGSDIKA